VDGLAQQAQAWVALPWAFRRSSPARPLLLGAWRVRNRSKRRENRHEDLPAVNVVTAEEAVEESLPGLTS
jgi:hypothetical protein